MKKPNHPETDAEKIRRLSRTGIRSGKDSRDMMKLIAKGKINFPKKF